MSAEASGRSLAFVLARGAISLLGGIAGFGAGDLLLRSGFLTGPNNLLYLTLVGLLSGYLLSAPLARRWERWWQRLVRSAGRIPAEAVLAAGTGATVALIITVLLNNLLAAVPGFTWYWSLLIALLLVIASAWFFVANRHLFPLTRLQGDGSPPRVAPQEALRAKLIDTSAVIDGRIADVIDANFIDGELLIPRFILAELQHIADADDPLRRRRGRRGLEVLDRLVQQTKMTCRVINEDVAGIAKVDEKLVQLCLTLGADLITTDYNLNRIAALQGIRVLNVNQLANAVKAMYLPGERLSLYIVRPGREPGQGLAYLDDGTMVVVEDAAELVGQTIETVVTSNLQTNMGRMIFAKPDAAATSAPTSDTASTAP